MIVRFIERLAAIKHINLMHDAKVYISKNVRICCKPTSSIIAYKGSSHIGYEFPESPPRATYNKGVIAIDRGAIVEIHGPILIAPGVYIHVCEGAKLVFKGENCIAHNTSLIVGKYMEIGNNTSISWNVTLIDYDKRRFYTQDGKIAPTEARPLILGSNCGLQMNVVVPKGIVVGDNTMVGANTVLRRDVPGNSLVYQNPDLRIKKNITTGFQFLNNKM